jgi:hypothetical protein
MTLKKNAAQLDQEIAAVLARPKGKVIDVKARSPDAEFILEGEEFDLPWTEEQRPLHWFNVVGGQRLESQTLDKQDRDRMDAIRGWAKSRGGLAKALRESPILAWEDGTVLDGTHRLLVALDQGLRTVTTLVGHRPPGWDAT